MSAAGETPHLSLVLACYNEAQHIRQSFAEIRDTLEQAGWPFEVVFVDDRSRDGTPEMTGYAFLYAAEAHYHAHDAERAVASARQIEEWKGDGYWVYGLEPGGEMPWEVDLTGRVVLFRRRRRLLAVAQVLTS